MLPQQELLELELEHRLKLMLQLVLEPIVQE